MCGEKVTMSDACAKSMGSPPRMRGKAVEMKLAGTVHGITPACAGKSGAPTWATAATGDHPRVCGEKKSKQTVTPLPTGSPPRMRGKESRNPKGKVQKGITPAYAGKRQSGKQRHMDNRDHPRVCGEKASDVIKGLVCQGSPPRMRGKGSPHHARRKEPGITPAYAGKS